MGGSSVSLFQEIPLHFLLGGDLSLEETEKGRFLALTVVTDEAEAACRR